MSNDAPNTKTPAKAEPRAVRMLLNRHYVPRNLLNIVGHNVEAVVVKDAAGRPVFLQEARFVEGQMKPHNFPGVGFPNKIWAGTIIEVPEDEGREMQKNRIAEVVI